MKNLFKIFIQGFLFLFPWIIRRPLLNLIFKFNIDKTAYIGKSIILADQLSMGPHSAIHNFVFIKNIDSITLKQFAKLGGFNFLSGFNTKNKKVFQHGSSRKCEFVLGVHTRVTSKHFFDCNGGIYIGDYTTIAGSGTEILTHSIDVYKNIQDTAAVTIGNYCFVGTKAIILKGSSLPDYSILGAGSVLIHNYTQSHAVYGGNPAKFIKDLSGSEVKYFTRSHGNVD